MVQKDSPIPSSTDKSHVIRTSAQWDSSGDQFQVIPRGVLCVELTSNGKTKIKIGEGNKFYSQLPYICDMEDLSNYYTKEEVDLIIDNLEFMSIKSTAEYESRNQLPKNGNKLGDVRFVKNPNNQHDDPLLYVWNGTKWVFSGGSIIDIDLSEYCKKSEILPRLQQLEALSHTHRNKNILDNTSAIYTIEKDEKLASLENGVMDITQENPEALNEITIHFDDSEKVLTLPTGGEAYVLPPATDTTLGGVIVGDGLAVDEDGVLITIEYQAGSGLYTSGGGILPSEYLQVDYLESTGIQYIDPDVPFYNDNVSKCEITFAYIELINDTWAVGAYNWWYGYVRGVGPINGRWYTDSGTVYEPNIFQTETVITAQFNYNRSYSKVYLFCREDAMSGVPASFSKSRIYHMQVTRNEEVIIDMYPCIRKADGVPGMYDIARNEFYTNDGTGDFLYGNIIPTGGNTFNVNVGQGISINNENQVVNDGVLDVSLKQSSPGVFTVTKPSSDTDIDLFDSLGKITINCNMDPD